MKLSVARLDLKKTRDNWPSDTPFEPAIIKPVRQVGGANWYILDQAFVPGEQPVWAYSTHDEYLRVPLFSYDLHPKADLALAFILQLGLSCAGYLPGAVGHLFIATGNPVELVYDPDTEQHSGLRYWCGFAVKLL